MDRDVSRTTLEAFFLSIGSLRRTDLRPLLNQIKVPVMGMYRRQGYYCAPAAVETSYWLGFLMRASNVSTRQDTSSCLMIHPGSWRPCRDFLDSEVPVP